MRRTHTGTSNEAPVSVVLEWPDPDLPRLPRTYVPRRRLADQLDRATQAPRDPPRGARRRGQDARRVGLAAGGPRRRGPICARPELAEATWVHADRTWDVGRVRQLLDRAADRDGAPRLVVVDDAHDLPPSSLRLIDQRLTASPAEPARAPAQPLGPPPDALRSRAARAHHRAPRRRAADGSRRGGRAHRRPRAHDLGRGLRGDQRAGRRGGARRSSSPPAPSARPPTPSQRPATSPGATPRSPTRWRARCSRRCNRSNGTCCSARPVRRSSRSRPRRC